MDRMAELDDLRGPARGVLRQRVAPGERRHADGGALLVVGIQNRLVEGAVGQDRCSRRKAQEQNCRDAHIGPPRSFRHNTRGM